MALFRLSNISRLDQFKIYTPLFINTLDLSHKRELMLFDQSSKLLTRLRKLCNPDQNLSYFAFQLNGETIRENELKVYGKALVEIIQSLLDHDLAMPVFCISREVSEEMSEVAEESVFSSIKVGLAIVSYSGERVEEKYSFAFNSIAAGSYTNLQNFLVDNFECKISDFQNLNPLFLNTKPKSLIRKLIEDLETPFTIQEKFRNEFIEFIEQGFIESEIFFEIPILGWVYFDTTDAIKQTNDLESFIYQTVIPFFINLEKGVEKEFNLMLSKIENFPYDELRPKTYLPQIEFSKHIISNFHAEEHPSVEFIKIYHLLCVRAEKIAEEIAKRDTKNHYDVLYTLLKTGDDFISRFLLIDQEMYTGHDRILSELKKADDLMYCEYYFNQKFYWIFLSKDLESVNIVLEKIIEHYYDGDHTFFIFETLMEKYPNVKNALLKNRKFKSLYIAAKNTVYWKQVSFVYRLFKFFIGEEFPKSWEKSILSQIKYNQMKVKYLPRKYSKTERSKGEEYS